MSQRPSKSDMLYARMRQDILTLAWPPGGALRLPAISKMYGIGVTPVRECLNRLVSDSLVVVEHNKGFRVAELSMRDLLDLEHSRSAIEGTLFLRAIERGTDAWEAGIIGTYHQLSACPAMSVISPQADIDRWNRRHGAFHAALIAGADAPWLEHFHQQLSDQLGRYQLFIQNGLRDLYESHPDTAPQAAAVYAQAMAMAPHETIYQVALSRDVTATRTVMEEHVGLSIRAFETLQALLPAGATLAETLGTPMMEPLP